VLTLDKRQNVRPSHITSFDWQVSWDRLAVAMRYLIGTDMPSAIARYLGPQVTDQNVRDWRRGYAGIPKWVLETARVRILEREAKAAEIASLVGSARPAPGQGSHRNICKWNAARNRLIRE
jgi:hypothetical protein